MAPQPPRKILAIDRPFGLLLWHRRSGAVVFAGAIYEL